MPRISVGTMIVAIQAVDAQVRELRLAVGRGDAEPEEHQILEEWMEAAADLERAYKEAALTIINLSPYDRLIQKG